ncbi:MAG: hypothetical protein WCK47_06675 [bacterium]
MNADPVKEYLVVLVFRAVIVIAAQFVCGLAVLSFFREHTLRRMARAEKFAFALLFGLAVPALISLMLLFTGARLNGWWWTSTFAVCAALLIARRGSLTRLSPSPAPVKPLFGSLPIGALVAAGVVVLFAWNIVSSLLLPTTDYDGIVIWSYRLEVLFNERTIFTESLRDPQRLIAQPLHPYLLPMIEIVYALTFGSLATAATHIPYILVYAVYIALSVSAARLAPEPRRCAVMAAALLLMPVMATGFSTLSAREPFMAVYGLAAVFCLARWQKDRSPEYLISGAFFALVIQQIKIEGLPFAAGWMAAALVEGLTTKPDPSAGGFERTSPEAAADQQPVSAPPSRPRSLMLMFALAAALVMLALPWHFVKAGIPRAHADPFMSDYSLSALVSPRHLPFVCMLILREVLFRPEYYAFAGYAVLVGLGSGWRRRNALRRLVLLAAPVVCLCAVAAIYSQRQADLPPERNASITRRIVVFLPAMVFAAWYLPRGRRKNPPHRTSTFLMGAVASPPPAEK